MGGWNEDDERSEEPTRRDDDGTRLLPLSSPYGYTSRRFLQFTSLVPCLAHAVGFFARILTTNVICPHPPPSVTRRDALRAVHGRGEDG